MSIKVSEKNKNITIVVEKSAIGSIIQDAFTFGIMFLFMFANHIWLSGNWIVDVFVLVGVAALANKRKEQMALDEVIRKLESIKEEK